MPRYEITVAGRLGPSLRAAFPEMWFAQTMRCTILRLRVPQGVDLLDVADLLRDRGMVVQSVRLLESRRP